MNDPLRSRALSCTSCGAPLDLTHVSADAVVCGACGAGDSLAARGVTRIRSYRFPPVTHDTVERALRIALEGRDLQLRSLECSGEQAFPYLARLANLRAFLSATELTLGPDGIPEEMYRCLDWPYECPLALRADERAPTPWFPVPLIDSLVPNGETALTNVELALRNFDERLRIELTQDLERNCPPRWATTAVSVTGTTHGELLELWAPFVTVRYQVAPPGVGWALDFTGENGWYSGVYGPDGRFGGLLPGRQTAPLFVLGAAAIVILVLLSLVVLVVVMVVLGAATAPPGP